MKTTEQLREICMEIYRQMYKEAEPSADFDELFNNGDESNPDSHTNYYLNYDRQNEIIDEICRRYKVYGKDREGINFEIHLVYSPNTSYEDWKERQ